MDTAKRKRLEAMGGRVTTVQEFLDLSDVDTQMIEIAINLQSALREARVVAGMSQTELAEKMGTRQPNIARLESGAGRGVTIDLLVRALLEVGVSRPMIAQIILDAEPPAKLGSVKTPAVENTLPVAIVRSSSRRLPGSTRSLPKRYEAHAKEPKL
jgi:transcriptional regulator with XRE-family HTH domain